MTVTSVSSTSIRIEWIQPYTQNQNRRVQYYTITIQDEDDIRVVRRQTSQLFRQLTSLHPNYRHIITVAAVTNTPGPNTTIYVQTLEDGEGKKLAWPVHSTCLSQSFHPVHAQEHT